MRLQQKLMELRRTDRVGNVLLLQERPPKRTLGRQANRAKYGGANFSV